MAVLDRRPDNDDRNNNINQKVDYSYRHMTIDELLDERNTLKKLNRPTSWVDNELYQRTFF